MADAGELVASLLGTFSERASMSSRVASDSVKPAAVAVVNNILPSNVAQNASITVRGALGKRPMEAVIACVANMDVDALGGMDVASALMKLSPIYEEKAAALSSFAGPLDKLAAGEQFLILVARELPTFFARLKVLELQFSLPELAASFFNRCSLFSSICAEIRESKRLQTLLADVILPLGQKLNQGNRRLAACAGIRLSSLPELARVRGESGETFLQFVISSLLDKAPSVLEFGQDFPKLLSTKLDTLAFSVFQEELAALNAGLRDVTTLHAA